MASIPDQWTQPLLPFVNARRWLVGYSGGVDSHVLLHMLSTQLQSLEPRPELVAVHINHQLQPSAGQWAQHCQQQADQLAVPLLINTVTVNCVGGESLEDKARQARYRAFEALMEPGDVLMMGHHLDDQVETLLLRLLRGSGSHGASAMPQQRAIGCGELCRPLLTTPRADITAYARQHQLQWVEDPSNQQQQFDRNYLRLSVLPVLASRWPEYRQTLGRAAALNEESARLNSELAAVDFHQLGLFVNSPSIPLAALAELSPARQKNLLRHWLQHRSIALPTAAQLQKVLDEVVAAQPDAEPLVNWRGGQARRFKGELYMMEPLVAFDRASRFRWALDTTQTMAGAGQLSARRVIGKGLNAAKLADDCVEVRFRQGGERCQPAGRSGSQTLKKLFQEYALETWLRDRAPLLYCGDELVAVADLWVCEHWQASGTEPGWQVQWQAVK